MKTRLLFLLDPTCDAVPGSYITNTYSVNEGNGINTPLIMFLILPHFTTINGSMVMQAPRGWIYTAPQPMLSGGGNYASVNDTAKWLLVLQNLSNALPAPNSWLYLCPVNAMDTLSNITVKVGNTTLTKRCTWILFPGYISRFRHD